jgi:hypothetical protein
LGTERALAPGGHRLHCLRAQRNEDRLWTPQRYIQQRLKMQRALTCCASVRAALLRTR